MTTGLRRGELLGLRWQDVDLEAGKLAVRQSLEARERLLLGPAYHDSGLVLARADGRPLDPAETTRAFARLVQKARVRRISLHGLRHTHATLLLGANVHPKVVSERLGHATVGITLDTYSHVLPTLQEEARNKLEGLLARSAGARRRDSD